ncbi:hypothetical protein NB311A_16097 [Nitrobacter sp. Nb-311A]|nr:hypothetical protein NB311A_16097 [Nitrobacter sp. Nb-311A]
MKSRLPRRSQAPSDRDVITPLQ